MIYRLREKQAHGRRRFFRKRFSLRASLSVLPHLFTLGNAFFGLYSMVMASQGEYVTAAYLILIGALMDALDGRIAKMVGSETELGMQLDSLADAVSFCVAPSLLLYHWFFKQIGFVGFIVISLILMAGILRLARFNLICHQKTNHFVGVPTTVVGCFVASMVLNTDLFIAVPYLALSLFFVVPLLAWLMVSKVKFVPAFKQNNLIKKRHYVVFSAFVVFASAASFGVPRALLALLIAYFIGAISLNFTGYYRQELD